jgi:acetoin utilization protein AcuC
MRPVFIGSEIYRKSSYGPWHPLRVPRVSTVMDMCRAMDWLPREAYVNSPMAKPKALEVWHDPDYLAALVAAERDQGVSDRVRERHGLGTASNPVFPEMYRRPATSAGGALLAGDFLKDGGVVYHPAGGTHHGMPDRANGFCYLNDPVVSILSLRRNGVRRIAYIDIDAHHPDGVEHAFAADGDILMISVHEAGRWPKTGNLDDVGVGNCFNLPVAAGFNDSEMALVRDELISAKLQAFAPDAIVLQCGADGVEEDPQSRLSLSNNAHWDVVCRAMDMAPRLLVLGGGGYNPWSVGRLWSGVWATLNGYEIPDFLPSQAEAVLRKLTFEGNSRGRNPPAHWFTTLRDAPRDGPLGADVRKDVAHLAARQSV